MSFWQKAQKFADKFRKQPVQHLPEVGEGYLLFSHTSEVIRAERLLKDAGLPVQVVGPPPSVREGCDMALLFPIVLEVAVRETLAKANMSPLHLLPRKEGMLDPVSLFHARILRGEEDYLMVRAANMKITLAIGGAESGRIVNISGGGCPDVPYLAALLVGQYLTQAPEPVQNGKTLCAYSLQKAFEEAGRLFNDSKALAEVPVTHVRVEEAAPCVPDVPVIAYPKRQWAICGTVPDPDFPLDASFWDVQGKNLVSDQGLVLPVMRGTAALLASAIATCKALRTPPPFAFLVGDTGEGKGSRALYTYLGETLPGSLYDGLTFHYFFPDVDGHSRVRMAVDAMPRKPMLVADAGFMYVAKMSGSAPLYDVFTPDIGELAFLADEDAPHPFYTRGFLLAEEKDAAPLARRAFEAENSAKYLLAKGATDSLIYEGTIIEQVHTPCVPAMEAMGGTGDFVTGMLTGLLVSGLDLEEAAIIAMCANRYLGLLASPNPATQVGSLLPYIPSALAMAFAVNK